MKRNNVLLASAAAAVLAAFNPAFAGGDSEYNKDKSANSSASSEEKLTGLDRADRAAGEHGQQGRDNAREKQERERISQAPSTDMDPRTGLDQAHPAN